MLIETVAPPTPNVYIDHYRFSRPGAAPSARRPGTRITEEDWADPDEKSAWRRSVDRSLIDDEHPLSADDLWDDDDDEWEDEDD